MSLYDKILKLQYENNLSATEFMAKTGFSTTLYYAIKDGSKSKLKPLHARILCDKFGIEDMNWFFEDEEKTIKTNSEETNLKTKKTPKITDEDVEVEFVKRFSRLRNRPIIKMVIDSQIELEVSKRLIKMSQTGELKKWLDT